MQYSSIIIGKLLNIGGMLQRKANQQLLPFDLNQQQFSIFFEIAQTEKVKQKDIVNRLLLEKAHISKVVKKLEKMGLITVTTSKEDKRSSWLTTTPLGDSTLRKCLEVFGIWNREWLGKIDKNDLAPILDNLTTLQAVFKNQMEK